jgi:hypothetical protein
MELGSIVFTLPPQLASLALQNKKVIYGLLLRASAETLLGSCNPRSSLPGSDRYSEKTGSSTPKPPFGGPEYVLQFLGRYTHRVAISNHRLVSLARLRAQQ